MVELEYDSLTGTLQVQIDSLVRMSKKDAEYEEDLEELEEDLEEHFGTELKPNQLSLWITNMQLALKRRIEVFHPQEGIIRLFIYHGESMKDLPVSGNKQNKIKEVVKTLIDNNDASTLKPTIAFKENPQNLERLKELVGNNQGWLSDEEVELIKIMIKMGDKGKVKEQVEYSYESTTKMKELMSTFSHIPSNERKNYYNYWSSVSAKFSDITSQLFPILNRSAEWGSERSKGDNPNYYGEIDYDLQTEQARERRKKVVDETRETFGENAEEALKIQDALAWETETDLILPNYIMELHPMPVKAMGDSDKTLDLVNRYMNFIGEATKETLASFGDEQGQVVHAPKGEIQESTESEADRTSIAELNEATEDTEDKVEELVKEELDPLFVLTVQTESEDINTNYTQNILDAAKKDIMAYRKSGTGQLAKEIQIFFEEHVDKFLEEYKQKGYVPPTGGKYYVPILDDSKHINIFDGAISRMGHYQVAVEAVNANGSDATKTFDTYKEAVEFVNKNTIRFFNALKKVYKMKESKHGITGKPPRMASSVYGAGSTRQSFPPEPAEADTELFEALPNLNKAINDYYVNPLSNNLYLINQDKPSFYEHSSFRTYMEISENDIIQQVINDLSVHGDLDITEGQLESLDNLIKALRKGNKLYFTTELKKTYSDALESFIAMFSGLPRDKISELKKILMVAFGDMLYEVALSTHSGNVKKFGAEIWEGKSLIYWNNQEKVTGTDLPYVAELLVRPEWEQMMGRIEQKRTGIWAKYQKLLGSIKGLSKDKPFDKKASDLTNAMLYTKDLLLKMKGESQYIASMDLYDVDDISFVVDLIQKEDRIDLYATDIEKIVKHDGAFKTVAGDLGIDEHIIYKIKGMFRGY